MKNEIEEFLYRVESYCRTKDFDSAILYIVDQIDDWYKEGCLYLIDLLFLEIDLSKLEENSLVAILASTIYKKENFENRSKFFSNVRKKLLFDYENDISKVDFILQGLK